MTSREDGRRVSDDVGIVDVEGWVCIFHETPMEFATAEELQAHLTAEHGMEWM